MTETVSTDQPVKAAKIISLRRLLTFMFPSTIGLIALFNGIQSVIIPGQIASIDPVHKVADLAVMTTFVAIASMVGIPLGGALSDRTRSRFGRRTPWIVGTSVVSGVLMIAMGVTENLIILGIVYAALWLTSNMYQGAMLAIVPDRVPRAKRGTASSVIGVASPIGVLVGVQVAGAVSQFLGYAIIAVIVVVTAFALVIGAREKPATGEVVTAEGDDALLDTDTRVAAATTLEELPHTRRGLSGFLEAFRVHDFRFAFISRFLLFLSYATVSGYLYYTLSDYIGIKNIPGGNVKAAVTLLLSITVISWVVIASFCGWLADRINRRKMFVAISAIGLGAAMVVPIVSPTWGGMIVYSILGGIFIGTYYAVDIAVMSLVLPSAKSAGRDFGILAVATGLPTILSGAIAGSLILISGGYTALYVFGIICAVAAGITTFFIKSVR